MSRWTVLAQWIGDVARPLSIIILAAAIAISLFVPSATVDKITAVGFVLGLFVGARSWENSTQIKANASVAKTETAVTGQPAAKNGLTTPPAPQ